MADTMATVMADTTATVTVMMLTIL
jgi:hypothetical protein